MVIEDINSWENCFFEFGPPWAISQVEGAATLISFYPRKERI
jgi:hypothetical protein